MYANNYNSGLLSEDPSNYVFCDITDAQHGNCNWISYDEMRAEASGEKYDCFTDETCYGYFWDYDKENYIPALKQYANERFYNRHKGVTDFFGMFKDYCDMYGEYPDFEDDEWWDFDNEIMGEFDTEFNYYDPITSTDEFRNQLYQILIYDSDLRNDFDGSDEEFDSACYEVASDDLPLLQPNATYNNPWYKVTIDGNEYYVDADYVWDAIRSY